jgi:hypothetical protein
MVSAGLFAIGNSRTDNLSESQKGELADRNRWPAFVLNAALGFGIGSYIQGDSSGGETGTILDGTTAAAFVLGMAAENGIMILAGLGLFVGSRIYQLSRPFIYANGFYIDAKIKENGDGKPELTGYIGFRF